MTTSPTLRTARSVGRRARGVGLSALVCTAALALVASASSAADAASHTAKKTAEVTSLAYGDPLESDASFAPVLTGFRSLSKRLGIHLYVYNNNDDASTGLNNAQLMAEDKPSVVVDWNAVASIGASLGRVFSNAHTRCIAVNTTIPGCPFFNLDDESLGESEGTAVGPLARAKGWNADDVTVVLVDDPAAGFTINSAIYGFYTEFAKDFPGMKQMAPKQFSATTTRVGNYNAVLINGDADLQDTYTALTTALETIPKGRHLVIDTLNDDSGLGALRALAQARRDTAADAMVVGNSVDADGLKELRTNPVWVADSSIFVNSWPRILVAMGDAMLNGVKPPTQTLPPQVALTKANVDKYYSGTKQISSPALPSTDHYLERFLAAAGG